VNSISEQASESDHWTFVRYLENTKPQVVMSSLGKERGDWLPELCCLHRLHSQLGLLPVSIIPDFFRKFPKETAERDPQSVTVILKNYFTVQKSSTCNCCFFSVLLNLKGQWHDKNFCLTVLKVKSVLSLRAPVVLTIALLWRKLTYSCCLLKKTNL
jgi:hypothetical protein